MRSHNPIFNVFKLLWRLLNFTREVFWNILFFMLLIVFFSAYMRVSTEPKKADYNVLKLDLNGIIVEESRMDPVLQHSYRQLQRAPKTTLLRDIVRTIEYAREDDNVQALVLDLDDLPPTSLTKLLTIGRALHAFKDSGKAIYAIGDDYSQGNYLLASFADQIFMNHAGSVSIDGFGVYPTYYQGLFKKFSVKPYIFRAGQYKSAVEPFLRENMSPQTKEANKAWLNDLWNMYRTTVAENRNIAENDVAPNPEKLIARFKAVDGDFSAYATDFGFIDRILTRRQMGEVITQEVTGSDDVKELKPISFDRYLNTVVGTFKNTRNKNSVAVITAAGEIHSGYQPSGVIGSDDVSELLQQAMDDETVKAVVLRLDTPGGSATASEHIRRDIEAVKKAGKQVVVSMGSAAASGGYWIAADADKIIAEPTTLTGSIGVFSVFFSLEDVLKRYGIHRDGVGTTEYANVSIQSDLPKPVQELFQLSVDSLYQNFLDIVAQGRTMQLDAVDRIAQGRVWSGIDAQKIGLIDELGGLSEAIDIAAKLAGIQEDYGVQYIRHQLEAHEQLLIELFAHIKHAGIAPDLLQSLRNAWLPWASVTAQFTDPNHQYALSPVDDLVLK